MFVESSDITQAHPHSATKCKSIVTTTGNTMQDWILSRAIYNAKLHKWMWKIFEVGASAIFTWNLPDGWEGRLSLKCACERFGCRSCVLGVFFLFFSFVNEKGPKLPNISQRARLALRTSVLPSLTYTRNTITRIPFLQWSLFGERICKLRSSSILSQHFFVIAALLYLQI